MIIDYADPNGEHITKVWRFDNCAAQEYRLENVKSDIIEFFPSIKERRLGISLSYNDSLVGNISLESDADLQVSAVYYCR